MLVELKTHKTYIKINQTNSFIELFKSPVVTIIIFVSKSNS